MHQTSASATKVTKKYNNQSISQKASNVTIREESSFIRSNGLTAVFSCVAAYTHEASPTKVVHDCIYVILLQMKNICMMHLIYYKS